MKKCHACGEKWDGFPGTQPGREESCLKCGADLHCCLNCRLYDPALSRQCMGRTVEFVRDKDKKNFCDEFEFVQDKPGGGSTPQGNLEKKWNDFFKQP